MTPLDAFDLPDWLGEGEVTWTSDDVTRSGSSVAGFLVGAGDDQHPCDLLAVDLAYPAPVVDDSIRTAAHQAWMHGQVLLLDRDGRPTLAVPGTSFTADTVLDAVTRLAKAVGAAPSAYSVRLRLGGS
ncbi:hypothetical protein [Nocardioides sp.]|uniref:hypothetical protein n=1 Tax=Nocardioides sp. TaxID=35761 RepID=UPI001A23C530|nr:hypothetical protein [Nocardioides sp.]MBJ7359533.1 hypothetical protein [Nocardioides sp.]